MRTKSSNSLLEVRDVSLSIGDKPILVNIDARAKSGDIFAILGPTGSGKTTLLNVISGRLKADSGSILLNGQPLLKRERRRMAFVQQQDVFFSQLTLWETLFFTANLRLPDSMSKAEKKEKVNDIVDTLDMRKCVDTLIGDIFTRGLSGGEKKRASVACELLTDPDILLLDEPTSGLDASTALSLMLQMRQYANQFNKMIISTIHQPSSQIYRSFNNILLLVRGHEAYHGPSLHAIDYFEKLGFVCEPHFNPADFLLQISKGEEASVDGILAAVRSNRNHKTDEILPGEHRLNGTNTNVNDDVNLTLDIDEKDVELSLLRKNSHDPSLCRGSDVTSRDRWITSWWTQYRMLSWRSLKQTKGVLLQGYGAAQTLVISLVCGLIYFQIDQTVHTVRDIMGLLFFAVSYWTFNPAFETITTYPSERAVISKERSAGSYRLSAYYCAKMTSDLPLTFILPTLMYIIFFTMSGVGGVVEFFATYPVILLQVLLSQAFGFVLGVWFKELKPALTTFVSYSLCAFMIGGFFSQNMPAWLVWAKYLSTILYPFCAVSIVIFRQMPPAPCNMTSIIEYSTCILNTTNHITYEDILHQAGITLPIHTYLLVLVAIIVAFRILGYVLLRCKRDTLL